MKPSQAAHPRSFDSRLRSQAKENARAIAMTRLHTSSAPQKTPSFGRRCERYATPPRGIQQSSTPHQRPFFSPTSPRPKTAITDSPARNATITRNHGSNNAAAIAATPHPNTSIEIADVPRKAETRRRSSRRTVTNPTPKEARATVSITAAALRSLRSDVHRAIAAATHNSAARPYAGAINLRTFPLPENEHIP
ncbi:unnamed protein product [[Actinomadura] parvosata subsp. kistnae]|nr:unnamed protein product [Actinomadura parvosata subsp. kistnae]